MAFNIRTKIKDAIGFAIVCENTNKGANQQPWFGGVTFIPESICNLQNLTMTKSPGLILTLLMFVTFSSSAQRVGIGTTNPLARFAVDSGILIDQSNLNLGNLTAGALVFGSEGLVGISRSMATGSGARNGLGFYTNGGRRMVIDSIGRIGIGTTIPLQRLHVEGNSYYSGNVGVGIIDPQYDIHIAGSSKIGGYLGINADPLSPYRLRISGNAYFQSSSVGINIAPSTTYSLYAAGNIRFTDDVRIDGELNPNNTLAIGNNATIAGSLSVGGRGIVRGSGSAQWRLVRATVAYAGGIAANSDLIGAAFAFGVGGATVAGIFVGPIVEAGAGSYNLQSLGLVATDISNTGCRFLIMNGSASIANMGTAENPTRWQLTLLVFD
jgi:hypothetical protein